MGYSQVLNEKRLALLMSVAQEKQIGKLGDSQFTVEKRKVLMDYDYRITHRSKETLLQYLKINAIRQPFHNDLGLYKKYWKQGFLVCSKSTRDLAADFGYSDKKHIQRMLKELQDNGELYVTSVTIGKPKPQSVYVLGIHNGTSNAVFEELMFTELIYNRDFNKDLMFYVRQVGASEVVMSDLLGVKLYPM